MGIDAKVVLEGHLSDGDIVNRLASAFRGAHLSSRRMRRPEHVILDMDFNGHQIAIELFLDSFAAEDYREIHVGPSVLAVFECGALSEDIASALVSDNGGFVMSREGGAWRRIAPLHCAQLRN